MIYLEINQNRTPRSPNTTIRLIIIERSLNIDLAKAYAVNLVDLNMSVFEVHTPSLLAGFTLMQQLQIFPFTSKALLHEYIDKFLFSKPLQLSVEQS